MIGILNLEEHIDFKDNHEEAKEWAKPYEEYAKTLADNQKEAIKTFTKDPSKINKYLEDRDVDPEKEINLDLESERFKLDYVTSGVKLSENLKVYQRMSEHDINYNRPLINENGEIDNLAANDLIEGLKKAPFRMQHGFMIGSLTKDPSTSPSMELPIRAEFILSKGTEGLYIGVENVADNPNELQMLCESGMLFQFQEGMIIKEKGKEFIKLVFHHTPTDIAIENIHEMDTLEWSFDEDGDEQLTFQSIEFKSNYFNPEGEQGEEVNSFDFKYFDYKVVNNDIDLGTKKRPPLSTEGILSIDLKSYNSGKGIPDVNTFQIFAVDPLTKREYTIMHYKPNVTFIGEEAGKIRFTIINKRLYISIKNENIPISNKQRPWHIYKIDELNQDEAIEELYTFLETMTPKQIKQNIEALPLRNSNLLITDRPYEVREWIVSNNGYYIDGIVISKKVHTPMTMYQVFLNGSDIGTTSPSKVLPDGSHEVLFTQDYFDIDGWGIASNYNEIQVYAIVLDKGFKYEVAHHIPKKREFSSIYSSGSITFNFYNSTCNIYYSDHPKKQRMNRIISEMK